MDIVQSWSQLMTILGVVVWGVRVEGKVKTLEAVHASQSEDIKERLVRIETKLDRSNSNI